MRANFGRGWHPRGEGGEGEEGGEEKRKKLGQTKGAREGRYVRCRECLGRPLQSGDDGARSVYTFWNILRFARSLRLEFLITCLLVEASSAVEVKSLSLYSSSIRDYKKGRGYFIPFIVSIIFILYHYSCH